MGITNCSLLSKMEPLTSLPATTVAFNGCQDIWRQRPPGLNYWKGDITVWWERDVLWTNTWFWKLTSFPITSFDNINFWRNHFSRGSPGELFRLRSCLPYPTKPAKALRRNWPDSILQLVQPPVSKNWSIVYQLLQWESFSIQWSPIYHVIS